MGRALAIYSTHLRRSADRRRSPSARPENSRRVFYKEVLEIAAE
jgi:hypothetical protein